MTDLSPLSRPLPDKEALLARLPALLAAIAPGAAARERARELPFAEFRQFRETGLGALRLPEALGGPGGKPSEVIALVARLAEAEPNLAHGLRSHFNFSEGLALNSDTAKARRFAEAILSGSLVGGAHTEAATLIPGDITVRLERTPEGLRLRGRKFYATGTAYADYGTFSALDDDGDFVAVLIPTDRPGLEILDDWDGMGQRMTASGGVVFNDVPVEPHEIEARGLDSRIGRHLSTLRQLHLCACSVGIVRNLLAEGRAYVQGSARTAAHAATRTPGEDPFVQQVIGRISAISYALDALLAEAARHLDASAEALATNAPDVEERLIASSLATARTQIVAADLALEAAQKLFETGGGSATSSARNFDRHWRNIRTILNHNPLAQKLRVVGDYELNGTTTHLAEGRVF